MESKLFDKYAKIIESPKTKTNEDKKGLESK